MYLEYIMGPKKATKKTDGASGEMGYCVKCQRVHTMGDTKKVQTKNGRNALSGKCKKYGTTMMKFVK